MITIYMLTMVIVAYWFEKELTKFPFKINRQIFQEYQQITNGNLFFYDFLKQSSLKYKPLRAIKSLYLLLPFIAFLFQNESVFILIVLAILVYLSFLDFNYYLTDIKYIAIIFISGLIFVTFYQNSAIEENIFSLLFSLIFFASIHLICSFIYKKEMLGIGDSLLIISLSPLFHIEQLLALLLYANLLGIIFASGYFFIKKYKISRLPFIPFISLSTFILFIDKIS
ncbi:Leader peptidase pppA [Phocoenobacter uteri]|uniref:Leader peptidase pppA n=1 Tax=Phocoenobacter uteri TaxID=146806 RepID=A0A379CB39_9PAST|nr:prepilin peptidase [Phocoenobacter uteri]MDG6882731.1 hypothetical protein [Phocoenobacter uteri]SUB58897.1 Leader peptidase pppA [Phocoenobacter uteri]